MAVYRYLLGDPLQHMGTTANWPQLIVCDTTAELPNSGLVLGSVVFDKQTGKMHRATSATVIAELGGSSGSTTWGGITGTLADQSDLNTALSGKAASGHDHNLTYAALNHNHDSAYSAVGHTHSYAALSHTHAAGDIATGTIAVARLGTGTPSASNYLRGDGAWAAVSGGSDPWTYLKVTVDFPTTSATAVDVSGLGFTPVANTTYEFEGQLLLRTGTATVNPRVGFAWATGLSDGVANIEQSQTATTSLQSKGNIAAALLVAVGGVPNNTQSWPATVWGVAVAGASPSGNIRIQIASETAGTTVTVKAGSFLKYRTI
jgi:hypothetical protein